MASMMTRLTTWMGVNSQANDLWIVASTVYGESRGEPDFGKRAVAAVIKNRQLFHPRWRDKTLAEISRTPKQFSCWDPDDPNYAKLLALTIATPDFAPCLQATIDILSGTVASPVARSTHFHTTAMHPVPGWAVGKTPHIVLGNHVFYQGIA